MWKLAEGRNKSVSNPMPLLKVKKAINNIAIVRDFKNFKEIDFWGIWKVNKIATNDHINNEINLNTGCVQMNNNKNVNIEIAKSRYANFLENELLTIWILIKDIVIIPANTAKTLFK